MKIGIYLIIKKQQYCEIFLEFKNCLFFLQRYFKCTFFLWWQSWIFAHAHTRAHTHTPHTHTHTQHTHTHTLTETERSTLLKSASVKYGWIIGSVFDVSGLQTSFMPRGRCSMIIALITSNIYSTFCFLLQVSDDARGPQFLICRDQICL